MNYWVGADGTDVMVPHGLCERLCAALPPDADQETRDKVRQELHSHWKQSDLSRPRSTASAAVVLEPASSTIPHE